MRRNCLWHRQATSLSEPTFVSGLLSMAWQTAPMRRMFEKSLTAASRRKRNSSTRATASSLVRASSTRHFKSSSSVIPSSDNSRLRVNNSSVGMPRIRRMAYGLKTTKNESVLSSTHTEMLFRYSPHTLPVSCPPPTPSTIIDFPR